MPTQSFPYSYYDNSDPAFLGLTGVKIHVNQTFKLTSIHWGAGEAGYPAPQYAKVMASDLTTQVGATKVWEMDDYANYYAYWDINEAPILEAGNDYFLCNYQTSDYFGIIFYPDSGPRVPIYGTYFNWIGAVWEDYEITDILPYYMNVQDVTLELYTPSSGQVVMIVDIE